MLTKNLVAFKKGYFIKCGQPYFQTNENTELITTLQAELMQLGYILDLNVFNYLSRTDEPIIPLFDEIISFIKEQNGSKRNYRPLYNNFPNEVMEMSHVELFINAIIHYFSNGTWSPSSELIDRGFRFENIKFKKIELIDESEFKLIFTKLVSINTSLTEDDKKIVEWFIDHYGVDQLMLPNEIPFKETLCMLASKGFNVNVKSVTDVLRIATYLSGLDISLPSLNNKWLRDNNKYKKFNRKERKQILSLLENSNCDVTEGQLKLGKWLRLGEILHPSEYKNQFPKAFDFFYKLRNQTKGSKIRTFNGNVNLLFNESLKGGLIALSNRPGEFARRLDSLIRNNPNDLNLILTTFLSISNNISNKVLFELYNHFLNRKTKEIHRSVIIKGKRSIHKELPILEPLDSKIIDDVCTIILRAIKNNFRNSDFLKDEISVSIDNKLKDIPLPFAMRSVNTSIKTYIRGTKVDFNKSSKVIRPYIHWFDENGDEDLDLSVGFYDENLNGVSHISYTNLKSDKLNSCHSGDVRHRQGACAEYVDIDIQKCLDNNIRYALVNVYNFNGRPMNSIKDCVFGLMEREFPESNTIFVPKTITNAIKFGNESSCVCVCILDLLEGKYIWSDIEVDGLGNINFENTKNKSLSVLKSLISVNKLSVYDLIQMHCDAKGIRIDDNSEKKLSFDDFATDYSKVGLLML